MPDVCAPSRHALAGTQRGLPDGPWFVSLPTCSQGGWGYSKPIASKFPTASFKSLYQKRSGPSVSLPSWVSSRRIVSDTALRHHGANPPALWIRGSVGAPAKLNARSKGTPNGIRLPFGMLSSFAGISTRRNRAPPHCVQTMNGQDDPFNEPATATLGSQPAGPCKRFA
jgi:hypothetical protein